MRLLNDRRRRHLRRRAPAGAGPPGFLHHCVSATILPALLILAAMTGCEGMAPPPMDDEPDNGDQATPQPTPTPAPPDGPDQPQDPDVQIDPSMEPSQADLGTYEDGAQRKAGAAMGPDGVQEEFVTTEVIIRPESEEDLEAFLARFGGTVIDDGRRDPPPGVTPVAPNEPSGLYLVRIDPARMSTEDLGDNLDSAGVEGRMRFSSADAAGLAALVLRARDEWTVSPNFLADAPAVQEHPDGSGGNLEAEDWEWMSTHGYGINVIGAWEYLRYWNVPPDPEPGGTVEWAPPTVALVDKGFALNETTGEPLDGNEDYFFFGDSGPPQYDFVNNDTRAGGSAADYHGSRSFGICCARSRNQYGGAGTGAVVARPIFLKRNNALTIMDAIRYAAIWYGADVINPSAAGPCGALCDVSGGREMYQNAVNTAVALGSIVVAPAGNSGVDVSNKDILPCNLDNVICVGGLKLFEDSGRIVNQYNHGDRVDIWAPSIVGTSGLLTTVTPNSAARDDNDVGEDEVDTMSGTSVASPFVCGVVALMRALDPSIAWDEVQDILQTTSLSADEDLVSEGCVNAYAAVRAVRPNQPPMVEIISPQDGAAVSYNSVRMEARAIDPEPGAVQEDVDVLFLPRTFDDESPCLSPDPHYDGQGNLSWVCNRDFVNADNQTHELLVRATDPHNQSATETIHFTVTNFAPTVEVVRPEDGATFVASQPVDMGVYVNDAEQLPFPDESVSWSSHLDGELGQGWSISVMLSAGTHVLTAEAVDERGASGQASVTVEVLSGESLPTGIITSPQDGVLVSPGTTVTLSATGTDPEDGALPDSAFRWISDQDGVLGAGSTLDVELSGSDDPCDDRVHVITLEVTDSEGNVVTDTISVRIGVIC